MAFLKLDDINYLEESTLENEYSKDINTESYFNSALTSISKINREYRESFVDFDKAIQEASLNENFEENIIDAYRVFKSTMNSIIDKCNKIIFTNHDNYISSLKRQMINDKIVLDKTKVTRVKVDNVYNFTFSDKIPKCDISKDLYYNEVSKLESILKNNSLSQDQKAINLLLVYNELKEDLNGGFYDRFRAEVLDRKGQTISAMEYGDVLFAVYRNGGQKTCIVFERDEILEIYKRFKNQKTYMNNIEHQKNSIIREYNSIKKELDRMKLSDIATMIGSKADVLDNRLDKYIKAKTEQIINMCNIHNLAYCAKLDALASMYIQDRSILTAVVSNYSDQVGPSLENAIIDNGIYEPMEEGKANQAVMYFKIHNKQNLKKIFKNHEYPGLLNLVKKTKKLEDLQYLKKDYYMGKNTFEKILKNIKNCEQLGDCEKTKNYYKGIKRKYLDNGITSKDVELTIKWYDTVYLPEINKRIKELKKDNA